LSPIRVLAFVLSLLTGAYAAIIAKFGFIPVATGCLRSPPQGAANCAGAPYYLGISSPELQGALLVVGIVLVIDAVVSFAGVRASFVLGTVLSAVVLAIFALSWGGPPTNVSEVAVILSVPTIVVDSFASSPSRTLSEKDSPLNLPVFG
jgi:hypothetical protein